LNERIPRYSFTSSLIPIFFCLDQKLSIILVYFLGRVFEGIG
jgi:hypothetical protein